jgi:hypothetical protein
MSSFKRKTRTAMLGPRPVAAPVLALAATAPLPIRRPLYAGELTITPDLGEAP